ncbi:hypothetical protein HU200_041444 [Digitaria exilis]|uniref:Uncharacterized protein n=1 Tax=Digitaria exilis TaxID=1010633 RepID=A0A835B609_9POAL|nr:hypothetical protein HU200_041444 [Digitaria exilis]
MMRRQWWETSQTRLGRSDSSHDRIKVVEEDAGVERVSPEARDGEDEGASGETLPRQRPGWRGEEEQVPWLQEGYGASLLDPFPLSRRVKAAPNRGAARSPYIKKTGAAPQGPHHPLALPQCLCLGSSASPAAATDTVAGDRGANLPSPAPNRCPPSRSSHVRLHQPPFGQTSFGTPQDSARLHLPPTIPSRRNLWQPNHNFRSTDWNLAVWRIHWCLWPAAIHPHIWHYIHWCLWPAAKYSHIWYPFILSIWELHACFRCIAYSCFRCIACSCFGASPAPAFGASPAPAFGATSSAFGSVRICTPSSFSLAGFTMLIVQGC